MLVYGNLERAALDLLASDPSAAGDKFVGRIWYHTGDARARYWDGTEIRSLVHAASTDTFTNKTFDVDGTGNTLSNIVNANIKAAAAIAVNKLAALTASRALVSDGSGFLSAATTTATEIGYVNGVTSAIQTQLDAKQARSTLTAKGSLYVATASATVAEQGIGADNTVLTADSAQTNGLKWASLASIGKTIVSKTQADSPYTITTDDLVLFSLNTASTVNLPAGSSGRQIRVTKVSTGFDVLTIEGDSAEQVRENGVSADNTTLNTAGESVELTWDGTLWEVTDRRIPCVPTAFTTTSGLTGGTTTFPGIWWRKGNLMKIQVHASFASVFTGGSATFTIPSGPLIDNSTAAFGVAPAANVDSFGVADLFDINVAAYRGIVLYSSTSAVAIRYVSDDAGTGDATAAASISTTAPFTWVNNDKIIFTAEFPIAGWKG